MSEMLMNVLGTVAAAVVLWGVRKILNYIDAKTSALGIVVDIQKKEYAKKRVLDVTRLAVAAVSQTLIKEVKKDGKLSKDDAIKALNQAKSIIMGAIRTEGLGYVAPELLHTTIEAVVNESKTIKNLLGEKL